MQTNNIAALHPDLQTRCVEFQRRLSANLGSDYLVIITSTYRDNEAQAALYASGRGEPGIILTRNKPGASAHNATRACAGEIAPASRAFDFMVFWHGKPCAEYGREYAAAGVIAAELGLLWGGRSAAKNREPGHVELPDGWQ